MIDPLAVNRSLAVAEKANGSFGSDILWVFVPAAVVVETVVEGVVADMLDPLLRNVFPSNAIGLPPDEAE